MIPLLADAADAAADRLGVDFVKWLLIGMGTGMVALAAFTAWLVKTLIAGQAVVAAAANASSSAVEENTEVLRAVRERMEANQ